jgi:hypothetical protein
MVLPPVFPSVSFGLFLSCALPLGIATRLNSNAQMMNILCRVRMLTSLSDVDLQIVGVALESFLIEAVR